MNNYVCVNATIEKIGLCEFINCKAKNNKLCSCMRYCETKKSIEHNDLAQYCELNPNKIELPKIETKI